MTNTEQRETQQSVTTVVNSHSSSVKSLITTIESISDEVNLASSSTSSANDREKKITSLLREASSHLISLKSSQRTACLLLDQKQQLVSKRRSSVEASRLTLENLAYEKEHLLKEIEACREFETNELEKMARTEMENESEEDEKSSDVRSSDEVIHSLFSNDNENKETTYRDPSRHKLNMDYLTSELNERKRLLYELDLSKKGLQLCRKKVKEKKEFLSTLPNLVEKVENVTLPLQDFFHLKENSQGGAVNTNSARKKRLTKARDLTGPLYVLCCQLEAYIDAFQGGEQNQKESVLLKLDVVDADVVPNQTDDHFFTPHNLGLNLRFSKCSPSSTDVTVNIVFQYLPKLNVVTAEARGNIHTSNLLVNLYPKDTGVDTPNLANLHLCDSATGLKFSGMPNKSTARPYIWAQWLAGLYFLPSAPPKNDNTLATDDPAFKRRKPNSLEDSTASVIQQIKRRIAGHSALSTILANLDKRPDPIPIHTKVSPDVFIFGSAARSNKPSSNVGVCLSTWTELSSDATQEYRCTQLPDSTFFSSSEGDRYFLSKFKSKAQFSNLILRGIVRISSEYPDVPPRWILFKGSKSAGNSAVHTSLHDNGIKSIETRVNINYEEYGKEGEDWILAHQVRMIVSCWSLILLDVSPNNVVGSRRGRDRTKVQKNP